jgi:hypothetical protein
VGDWWVIICKIVSLLYVAFGFKSGGPDLSLHSLHRWVGFHLIRSPLKKCPYSNFGKIKLGRQKFHTMPNIHVSSCKDIQKLREDEKRELLLENKRVVRGWVGSCV